MRSHWRDNYYYDYYWRFGGAFWSGYCAWADYFNEVLSVKIDRNYLDVSESCGMFWTLDSFCFASERPTHINRDDRGRLHSETRQSISYSSGWGLWHWHGVQVPRFVIEEPSLITAQMVKNESNSEVRRVMLSRLGEEKFVREIGAKPVHQDETGILYDFGDDTLAVHVINSTPEPDGSGKPYWLYVHPELRPMKRDERGNVELGEPQKRTARNAVASTFGLTGKEYTPVIES